MKKIVAAIFVSVFVLTGCSDKEDKKQEAKNFIQQIKITKDAVKRSFEKGESKENSGEFYYSYNEEKKRRTTLDAYLNIRSPYERVQVEMLIKRLSHDFMVKCSPCHDDYANGVIGPSLLDKDGDYIYKQLMAFKRGEKNNVLMKQLVEQIDDKKLKSIANEIAEFNAQIQKMRKER